MSTLAVVEEVLRETGVPLSVVEIVVRAGARLPSKSKTPDTVVARDLAMDIKRKGEGSLFIRSSPGRYTLRSIAVAADGKEPATAAVGPSAPLAATAVGASMGALDRGRAPTMSAKRDGCGSIVTGIDGSDSDHLTSLRRGRSRGSGLGMAPPA